MARRRGTKEKEEEEKEERGMSKRERRCGEGVEK